MELKLFSATIECWNSCYTQTYVIAAKDSSGAHRLIKEKRQKDHNTDYLKYLREVQEIPIKVSENEHEKIVEIWFGHNESKNRSMVDD